MSSMPLVGQDRRFNVLQEEIGLIWLILKSCPACLHTEVLMVRKEVHKRDIDYVVRCEHEDACDKLVILSHYNELQHWGFKLNE